ncbi:MAG: PTS cellobiose transporter subunit IIC [Atopobiaceae bacterium]|jgi:PTS system cellobiose-specific IIC component
MFDFLEKHLMGPMQKFSQFRLVRAITFAGMASIAFTIVGSAFLILSILPDVFPFLTGFFAVTFDKMTDLYMIGYNASVSTISIYFLIATTFEYARIFAAEDDVDIKPLNAVLLSIFMLFLLMPQFHIADGLIALMTSVTEAKGSYSGSVINGWTVGGSGVARLGATGIFEAIIISWASVRIYVLCVKKNIVVRLPDVVPDGVARSFSSLVPALFIAIVSMLVQGVLAALGTDFYTLVSIPFGFVVNLTDSWAGILVIYFLIHALWIVGIHGATIISSLIQPITLANFAANATEGGHYVLAGEFQNAFATIGGSGATLLLTFMLLFLAHSEQLKAIGKAEAIPAIFNINEPLLFGLPIVYNPDLAIPFFLAPMASASIAYWAITLGLCNPIIVAMPWPTPLGIGAFISTGGDWRAAIVALVGVAVAGAIYYPFFKRYDAKLCKEEEEQRKLEKAENATAAA